jgi:nitroimidazol reductase NimA-like FMN-containing flavoprotein (pyridoxamine 5'-phosphate oxidase superfamily)
MTTAGSSASASFQELSQDRCKELLASHTSGRVGWQASDGPLILPVTYAFYNGTVAFRTAPYGVLAELSRPTNVAFEIDEIDHDTGHGWSVLVRGRAKAVTQNFDLVTLWKMDKILPWASGTRNLFIEIEPRSISGRSVRAPYAT